MSAIRLAAKLGTLSLIFFSGVAFGFGGQIAVGMNAANEIDGIAVPFTADATLETPDFTLTTKIYYQSGKIRDEFSMQGQNIVYITRPDQRVTWMLMPQGFYLSISHDDIEQNSNEQMQQYRLVEREVVGDEDVNGMHTTRYRVIYETNDGRFDGFTWFNDDNIAVKAIMVSETEGERMRVNFEMTNLQVGPVDDGLFDLPPGAQALNMGGLLGGFGGANAGGGLFGGRQQPAADDQDGAEEEDSDGGVGQSVSRGFRSLRDRFKRD